MASQKVNSLKEIPEEYDFVINCTGNGAKELVGDDNVYPIRGQVHRVCFNLGYDCQSLPLIGFEIIFLISTSNKKQHEEIFREIEVHQFKV